MIKKVLALLSPAERLRGILLLAMMIVMAVMEVAGVVSIMPFLAVLGDHGVIETNPVLSRVYEYADSPPSQDFLFYLGVLTFVVILVGSLFKALTQYAMARFVHMRRHSIAHRLLQSYVRQPYEFFLNRNSSDLSKSVLSEVDQVVTQVIRPLVDLIAYSLVVVLIITMLVAVDVKVALILSLILGSVYALIYLMVRRTLSRIGADRVSANKERFTSAGEAFGGIKDIKLLGCEDVYLKRFSPPSRRFARHQATSAVLGIIPKYVVEAAAFGAILLVALYLLATQGNLSQVLPVLGLYSLAGYRLLPAMQHVYKDLAALRFGQPALNCLYQDFITKHNDQRYKGSSGESIELNKSLELRDITYTYPGATTPAIKGLSLAIPAHSTVGFVGSTGAGKTTLVDIVLGLLSPQKGQIFVDGHEILREKIRTWQVSLGYVPQQIYLTDETVAANIGFGKSLDKIDFQAVQRAAKTAALHRFIIQELPQGYDTPVGERGVRISGGQRQRIGIARALYHNPGVLILDEATSSLDNVTERYVIDAIEELKGERTIIMIAHRLSTVKGCDNIYVMESGYIVGSGTYEELSLNNTQFQAMALGAD